jgi:hypothetical protein
VYSIGFSISVKQYDVLFSPFTISLLAPQCRDVSTSN